MELQKKSELSVGRSSYVISTQLEGEDSPIIETRVLDSDGSVVFQTSQNISALKPIFQNSQRVYSRLMAQHQAVVDDLERGNIGAGTTGGAAAPTGSYTQDGESDALAHAVSLFASRNFEKATAALRAILDTYPNCSEAREMLEVAYKASSGLRLQMDVPAALKRGSEAFASGRQREAIESWKQCLAEEPENRRLQVLVLLATTWSPERRQQYAGEILAPGNRFLSSGRVEEAQALLLVTQTVESTMGEAPPPPPPGFSVVDEAAFAPPEFPMDHEMMDAPPYESQPDFSGVDETMVAPPPVAPPDYYVSDEMEEYGIADQMDEGTGAPAVPQAEYAAVSERNAPSPVYTEEFSVVDEATVQPSDLEALVPDYFDEPVDSDTHDTMVTTGPARAVFEPPPSVQVVETSRAQPGEPRPEPRTSPTTGRVPAVGRRPAPSAQREIPWAILGGAFGLLVVLGAVGLWWFSRDKTITPEVLERAASLVSAGQYPQAIEAYDEILGEYGDSAELYLGRGRAKLASGDNQGGLSDFEHALSLDPDSPAIAEEMADLLYSQGNYPAAIEYYEKAFAKGGGSVDGRYRIAVSLVREGRGDDALSHLNSAIAKAPDHGEAQFLYGQLLNERGRYEEAEKSLRSAEKNVEAGGDYLNQLGISLLEQQKLEEAEVIAHDFIRAYPSDARGRTLLGEIYLSRKQYEPARAQLIVALRTDPNDPRGQLALGRTWLAIGKIRGDAQDLSKAQQVLASAQGVHEGRRLLALGQVSIARAELDQALGLLQEALDKGAPELPVRLSLAEAKWRAQDQVGSAEELQRASGLAPGDPAVALSLAIAYFQLKDPVRAADQFLKSIQGIGLVAPPGEGNGPVMLPAPHIPMPDRFDINRSIRESCQTILKDLPEDPTATQLTALSQPTTFIVAASN